MTPRLLDRLVMATIALASMWGHVAKTHDARLVFDDADGAVMASPFDDGSEIVALAIASSDVFQLHPPAEFRDW
jgi:hypothetical protein